MVVLGSSGTDLEDVKNVLICFHNAINVQGIKKN